MNIKELKGSFSWTGDPVLEITVDRAEKAAADEIISQIGTDYAEYEIKIEKKKKKRSLDANAYAWVLMGKIAKKIKSKTKIDVYREYIRNTANYEILPIKAEAVKRWFEIWSDKGDGWICEDMGECRNTPGYHNIRSYYGSSAYNQEEMSHLIELIVADCKDMGIETLTPDEIERMKQAWK